MKVAELLPMEWYPFFLRERISSPLGINSFVEGITSEVEQIPSNQSGLPLEVSHGLEAHVNQLRERISSPLGINSFF